MIARFGRACARWAERNVPRPFVFALLLNGAVLLLGLLAAPGTGRPGRLLDAWYEGFFSKPLLAFAFQMALILVTGFVVADAPLVRRSLDRVAALWRTPAEAVGLAASAGLLLSFLHWGLGLVGGGLVAREIGRVALRRGRPVPYPLIVGATYGGFLVWHNGLSGSAPLAVAQPDHPFAAIAGAVPVSQTIFSPFNLLLTAAVGASVILLSMLMARGAEAAPPVRLAEEERAPRRENEAPAPGLGPRLARSRAVAAVVLLPALGWLLIRFGPGLISGEAGLDLDTILFLFLMLGLALHGTPERCADAFARGTGPAAGILLQFPFYFAALGVLRESGLVTRLAEGSVASAAWLAAHGLPAGWSFETLTFFSAALVNVAIPSGGGQWALQGEIVLRAAIDPAAGVPVGRAVIAFACGDAWTNMLQPFWALALLSITRTRAREIMGYTIALMIAVLPVYLVAFLF